MNIFCDGVFDLFHKGHVEHFKKIKNMYPNSYLIVGVLKDSEAKNYKRIPFYNESQRLSLVDACKYVDKVTLEYPIIMTEEFINNNKIDLVIHAFSNMSDFEKQKQFFEIPVRLNKMKVIEYNKGISTTNIIKDIYSYNRLNESHEEKTGWNKIWELKGKESTNNLTQLNGYENTDFDLNMCYKNIIYTLDIKPNEKILEVGCGGGQFSQLFNINFDYFGIDYSRTLINRNLLLTKSKLFNCEANDIPFKDKYFDCCFLVCVTEYLPSKEYAFNVIKEIERLTKSTIYILNIRLVTHETKLSKHKYDGDFQHLTYLPEEFIKLGYTICDASYEQDKRFSAFKKLN